MTDTVMATSSHRLVGSQDVILEDMLPEDVRERKRVLNVLAQRRYRRRKKQKEAALENMLTKVTGVTNDVADQARTITSRIVSNGTLALENESQGLDDRAHSTNTLNHDAFGDPAEAWFVDFLDTSHDTPNSWHSSTATLSNMLQIDEVQNTTFSDDYHLAVPELDLLRASLEIASRLHSAERLWDLKAGSIFQDTQYLELQSILELPENLQPTKTQLSVAHHPILDILPWPSIRDKLIQMYSMPPAFWPRHPDDGSECSIIRLVYDMEAGGVRVWGANPASEEAWEIEESLFAAWWWALDGRTLLASNRKRAARGQRPLQEMVLQRAVHTKPQAVRCSGHVEVEQA